MSAFSGASQHLMSHEIIVTLFSHPSNLTKLYSKKIYTKVIL